MGITKTPEQVEKMREAGRLLSECLDLLVQESTVGKSAFSIDCLAEEFIRDHGATPAFKDYSQPGTPPFPASICFSRNHVVVHGIPTKKTVIKEGDVITIDCGLELDGWFADAARLFGIGTISSEDKEMVLQSEKVLDAGIQACRPGNMLGDVCHSIQNAIVASPFYNVYHFSGHAIGEKMHESPQVPNFGRPGTGIHLEPGMVFCLEPILRKYRETKLGLLEDGWTVITQDGSNATHIEHMVLVTEDIPEILTSGS